MTRHTSPTQRPTHRFARQLTGRRRIAIVGLAGLTATVIIAPASAPFVAVAASVLLVWGLWSRPSDADATPKHCEPSLWDDGFGAT